MTISTYFSQPFNVAYIVLLGLNCILSSLCSMVVIYIVLYLVSGNNYKGHLLMIGVMSVTQCVYDFVFFFAIVSLGSSELVIAAVSIERLTGISTTLITNYIALIAFYTVQRRVFVNVSKIFPALFLISFIPGIVDVLLFVHENTQNLANTLYLWFRIASIILNAVLCVFIFFSVRSFTTKVATIHDKALHLLAMRLMYYPVVQTISRGAISWYEFTFGFNFNTSNCSPDFCAGLMIAVLFNPMASYGYLGIFLVMQPQAYTIFRSLSIGKLSIWNYLCFWIDSNTEVELPNNDVKDGSDEDDYMTKCLIEQHIEISSRAADMTEFLISGRSTFARKSESPSIFNSEFGGPQSSLTSRPSDNPTIEL